MATGTLHIEPAPATPAGVHLGREATLALAALSSAAHRAKAVLQLVQWNDHFDQLPEERAAMVEGARTSRDALVHLLSAVLNDLEAATSSEGFCSLAGAVERLPGINLYG